MGEKPKSITFKYVYPEDLRDLYVNGLYGGVTPRSEIYAHFYSERHPIPKTVKHEIDEKGILGPEISMERGGDVVRFIQASVVMDIMTATAVRDWITQQIETAKSMIEMGKKDGTEK